MLAHVQGVTGIDTYLVVFLQLGGPSYRVRRPLLHLPSLFLLLFFARSLFFLSCSEAGFVACFKELLAALFLEFVFI